MIEINIQHSVPVGVAGTRQPLRDFGRGREADRVGCESARKFELGIGNGKLDEVLQDLDPFERVDL